MTKRRALSILAAAATTALGLQAAIAAKLKRRGAPKWGKAVLAMGIAADALFIYSHLVPNFPLTGRVFHRGSPQQNTLALTFDDGPRPPYTQEILDVLQHEGVKATFFVLGENAARYPELVGRIAAAGHLVANHGWDHSILMFAGARAAQAQIAAADRAYRDAGVKQPAPLFRAPHGWLGPLAHRATVAAGYRVIGWGKGVWDTANPGVETIVSRTAESLKPGSILLLHDGWSGNAVEERAQTVAALPQIIAQARARGLRFVTLDEMLEQS